MNALVLTEAKKNLEVERQKADQAVKAAIQQGLAEISTAIQRHEEEKDKHIQALQEVVKQKATEFDSIAHIGIYRGLSLTLRESSSV